MSELHWSEQSISTEKQALLTTLREEVEEQKYWMMKRETLYNVREYETGLNIFDGLLALLEKAGE